jgi:hypothetical protein
MSRYRGSLLSILNMSHHEIELIPLQDALKSRPICSGVYTTTSPEDFILFYSGRDHPEYVASYLVFNLCTSHVDSILPRRIDMTNAGVPELVQLLSSCTTLGEEDVLGEGFRKAGKLGEFAMKFDPTRSGILDVAAKELLDGEKGEIEAELEGFYVYGGSTFYFAVDEKTKNPRQGLVYQDGKHEPRNACHCISYRVRRGQSRCP